MPYIKEEDYVRAEEKPAVPGELNFALTVRAIHYFMGNIEAAQFKEQARHLVTHYMERVGVSYTNYNAVVGVLMCCGWELHRRAKGSTYEWIAQDAKFTLRDLANDLYHGATVPYEDEKIEENGDVFPPNFFNPEVDPRYTVEGE